MQHDLKTFHSQSPDTAKNMKQAYQNLEAWRKNSSGPASSRSAGSAYAPILLMNFRLSGADLYYCISKDQFCF
jgi:hypothetical protein